MEIPAEADVGTVDENGDVRWPTSSSFVLSGLPHKMGGLGLGNAWLENGAAWVSSFYAAVKAAAVAAASGAGGSEFVLKALQKTFDNEVSPYLQQFKSFISSVTDGETSVNDFGVNITDPLLQNVPDPIWEECLQQPPRAASNGIQQAMMTLYNKVAWAAMVRCRLEIGPDGKWVLDPQDKAYAARLVSMCQRGVRSALQAIPSQFDLEIPNEALKYHIRLMLDDPLLAQEEKLIAERCCPGCSVSEHVRSCVKGGGMFARHASICRALRTCLTKLANVDVQYDEKLDADQGSGMRPDLIATGFAPRARDTLIEVATVNPSGVALREKAADKALHAASLREKAKSDKYKTLAEAADAEVKIAAVEVMGGYGVQLNDIVGRIASRFKHSGRSLREEFNTTFTAQTAATLCNQIIGVAMIKGNYTAVSRMRRNVYYPQD